MTSRSGGLLEPNVSVLLVRLTAAECHWFKLALNEKSHIPGPSLLQVRADSRRKIKQHFFSSEVARCLGPKQVEIIVAKYVKTSGVETTFDPAQELGRKFVVALAAG